MRASRRAFKPRDAADIAPDGAPPPPQS